MIEVKRIFPECYADTLLVKLILQRGNPAHYKGIHNVAAALQKHQNHTQFTVGLIDKDKVKNASNYIKKFIVVFEQDNLAILNLPGTQIYLIQLNPAFEKWLLAAAGSCGISLPNDYIFEHFKRDAKDINVEDISRCKKFINSVVEANPPAIQTLKFWLEKVFQ